MFLPLVAYLVANMAISFAAPVHLPNRSCIDIFREANVTRNFALYVGHAIHSINVEGLREFEPDFDAVNFIPTVNLDLLSSIPILTHAPMPAESDFKSQGMRDVDRVLSHMSNPSWDVKNYNALERLVHMFHMHEKWDFIQQEYAKVKAGPPGQDVCQCALDENDNGIIKMLQFINLAIRKPELVYGNVNQNKQDKSELGNVPQTAQQEKSNSQLGDKYFMHMLPHDKSELGNLPQTAQQEKSDSRLGDKYFMHMLPNKYVGPLPSQKTQVNQFDNLDLDEIRRDSPKHLPTLDNEAAWKIWHGNAKMMQNGARDAAVYLYCAHQRANLYKLGINQE